MQAIVSYAAVDVHMDDRLIPMGILTAGDLDVFDGMLTAAVTFKLQKSGFEIKVQYDQSGMQKVCGPLMLRERVCRQRFELHGNMHIMRLADEASGGPDVTAMRDACHASAQ